jgi:hypothetical protein
VIVHQPIKSAFDRTVVSLPFWLDDRTGATAAVLEFLATATRAKIIAPDLGTHGLMSTRDRPQRPRELVPGLAPTGFNCRDARKLDRLESDACAPLSFTSWRNDGQLVFEIEALKGYLRSQEVDPIEPPKHFLDAREPGRDLLVFTIGIRQCQLTQA